MATNFTSKLLFLIVFNIAISGSVITFAQQNKQDQDHEQQQAGEIYGIRWFLGDYFAFHMPSNPPPNQEMFILMFNSQEELDDQIYLLINGTRYGCYERFLEIQSVGEHHYQHNKEGSKPGQNFTNAMYKCVVYAQNFNGLSEIKYEIVSGWTIFQGTGNKTTIQRYREYILFQGKLRIPQNMQKLSFFFLADWGLITQEVEKSKGYKDVRPSMIKTLADNPEMGLIVFGGDLAYDFQGKMYIQMLKYLQPLTSFVATIATPGNHESVYHQDSLELFVQSFYTPMWYKYFNYFSLTVIQAHKLVILSYDPQNYIFPWINRLDENLSTIFEDQINKQTAQFINKNYDVMAVSHYPMYCSQPGEHYKTCEQNHNKFEQFLKKFTQIGLDIYLSGHLHIYQRTKPMCSQSNFKHNDNNIYEKQCPVYIIEGDAGNNEWVQMQKRYQKQNFSETILYGTGYGVVTVDQRNLSYQHYHVFDKQNSSITDNFVLYEPKSNLTNQTDNEKRQKQLQNMGSRLIVGLQVIALVVIAGLACCLIYKFKKGRVKQMVGKQSNHVQMIEQNFETPPNNNKNMSKQSQTIE